MINSFQVKFDNLEFIIGIEIDPKIDTVKVANMVSNNFQSIAGGTFNMIISIAIMYLLLYYMLINSKNMISTFYKYLPFKRENLSIIATECRKMVRANAIGIPVVAIFQGFVSLISFLIFGVADPFFCFVIIVILYIIPMI